MHSEVVFDVRQAGFAWGYPAAILTLFAFGAVLLTINLIRKRRGLPAFTNASGNPVPRLPLFFMGISLIWCLVVLSTTFPAYKKLRTALEQGRCRVVEGPVQNFSPGGLGKGSTGESFDVAGVRFHYSIYSGPGFHRNAAEGGPLKEGIRVRIFEDQGDIARLEILRNPGAR